MDALSDLSFFAVLMKQGSLSAAAQELGLTPPLVSKRFAALEARIGVRLLHRTTRRISLTPEGEIYLTEGARVHDALDAVKRAVSGAKLAPRGLLKINSTLVWQTLYRAGPVGVRSGLSRCGGAVAPYRAALELGGAGL